MLCYVWSSNIHVNNNIQDFLTVVRKYLSLFKHLWDDEVEEELSKDT